MVIPEKALLFLKREINNFDANNYEEVNDLLDVVSDLLNYKGFDENYDLNDFGIEAQNIYDEIYYSN